MDKKLEDMTIGEVVLSDKFQNILAVELKIYRPTRILASTYSRLKDLGILNQNEFTLKYMQCLNKKCDLPHQLRALIIIIGNKVFDLTIHGYMADEKKRNKPNGDNQ